MKVQSEFVVSKWEEVNVPEYFPDSPMTRTSAEYTSSGNIQGVFQVEYIIHSTDSNLSADQISTYVGFLEFTGRIGEKTGIFVLNDTGSYIDGIPSGSLSIKPHSGTGGFSGILGKGMYSMQDNRMIMELDYFFEDEKVETEGFEGGTEGFEGETEHFEDETEHFEDETEHFEGETEHSGEIMEQNEDPSVI